MNVACSSQTTQWRHDTKSTFTSKPELQVCTIFFPLEVKTFINEVLHVTVQYLEILI